MGNFLSQVTTGVIKDEPVLALIYGVDGVGKSTFAAEAPAPIFIGAERGTARLNVSRFPAAKKFEDVQEQLHELGEASSLKYKTLVIDTLDWLSPLVYEHVAREAGKSSIEDIGYGKGYPRAMEKIRELIQQLDFIRDKQKMHILLLAHPKIKPFNDPTLTQSYDRYSLAMRDEEANLWRQYVDSVLFINFKVAVVKDDRRGYGTGQRFMYTKERPGFQAKERYGLPFELPMNYGSMWKTFWDAVQSSQPENPASLREEIAGYVETVDPKLRDKVNEAVKKAGDDARTLIGIRDQVLDVLKGRTL